MVGRRARLVAPMAGLAAMLLSVLSGWPMLSAAGTGTPDAAVAATDPAVNVTVTSLSPAIPVPGRPIRLRGTVTNTTATALRGKVRAYACADPDPISTPAQLAAVPGADDGSCRTLFSASFRGGQELGDSLAPGASAAIDVTVPWQALSINRNGVYVVGLKVIGGVNGRRVTVGSSRTLLSLINRGARLRKVQVVLGIPLTHRPAVLPNGQFLTNAIAGALTGNGRLGQLITAGQRKSVTWLVDPAMLAEIQQMAGGYQVRTASGPVTGPNQAIATNFLQRLRAAQTPANPMLLLPFGDPDIAALAGNRLGQVLATAVTLAAADGPARPGGSATSAWLERADALTVSALPAARPPPALSFVSWDSWATGAVGDVRIDPVVTIRTAGGPVRAVAVNPALTAAGPDTDRTPTQVTLRQRMLAETALVALSGTGPPATMVAVEPRDLDPSGVLSRGLVSALEAPWVIGIGAGQLLARPTPPTVPAPTGQLIPAVAGSDLAGIRDLAGQIELIGQVLTSPQPTVGVFNQALARSASQAFAADPPARARYLRDTLGLARGQFAKVRILPQKLVALSGSDGQFPLTIANDLDQTVRVGLRVTPINRTALRIKDPGVIEIAPNKKRTVTVEANSASSGLIKARAVLTAPGRASEERPALTVGQPTVFDIQAASYGKVGWGLVIGAAGLLFGTSVLRIVHRIRRERSAPGAADG